ARPADARLPGGRVVRRAGGARRRPAVPGARGGRPRRPPVPSRAGGQAVRPVRWAQPDQRPDPRPLRRAGAGGGPAGRLGQPALAPLPRRDPRPSGRRRPPPRAGLCHLGLRRSLVVPLVPRGAGRGQGRRRPRRAARHQAPPLLGPARVPGAAGRRRGPRPGRAASRQRRRLFRPQRPRGPGRGAPGGRRLRGAAPRGQPARRRARRSRPVRPRLPVAQRPTPAGVARARRQRPPLRPRCRRGAGGGRLPDRLHVRPHGGRVRPRHPGRGHRRRAGAGLPPLPHPRHRPPLRVHGRRSRRRGDRGSTGPRCRACLPSGVLRGQQPAYL
ncbi:MAG: Coproporphyrin ferrochelatase, partial [uncultured Acidimicrobiales bacterium]